MNFEPKIKSISDLQIFLQACIGPRPIALASTIDLNGKINLSPFSFFNVFSVHPPLLIFSPVNRVRDGTQKHTLLNIMQTKEVVINVVNFDMVEQTSLSSVEYEIGVNEFTKSGFKQIESVLVKPPRVAESPVAFECKVKEIIHLGEGRGSGNLVLCEVVFIHYKDEILNDKGIPDANKIDLVARMGENWYSRAKDGLFEIPKPSSTIGIGFDSLPLSVRESTILTGNDLARLASVEKVPLIDESSSQLFKSINNLSLSDKHIFAKELIRKGEIQAAWLVLLNE